MFLYHYNPEYLFRQRYENIIILSIVLQQICIDIFVFYERDLMKYIIC